VSGQLLLRQWAPFSHGELSLVSRSRSWRLAMATSSVVTQSGPAPRRCLAQSLPELLQSAVVMPLFVAFNSSSEHRR
jgi:hypothetical protein